MDRGLKDGVALGRPAAPAVGRAASLPVGVARSAVSWGSRLTALVGLNSLRTSGLSAVVHDETNLKTCPDDRWQNLTVRLQG